MVLLNHQEIGGTHDVQAGRGTGFCRLYYGRVDCLAGADQRGTGQAGQYRKDQ